jgi:magnesium transporter
VAIGLLAGVVALVVARDATVALAMAGAMLANFVAGGLVGVFVPAALRGLGLDPAVASVLFVTTATDALGVLFFLGSFTLLTLH